MSVFSFYHTRRKGVKRCAGKASFKALGEPFMMGEKMFQGSIRKVRKTAVI